MKQWLLTGTRAIDFAALTLILVIGYSCSAHAQALKVKEPDWYKANVEAEKARHPKPPAPPATKFTAADRAAYAKVLDTNMLKLGIDCEVTAVGKMLKINWVLSSRVTAYQLSHQHKEILENAWDAGFDHLTLTDGYEFSWEWDLRKLKRNR